MDTDNKQEKLHDPDDPNDDRNYVTDIDGNRVKKVLLGSEGIVDFGYALIEALYGGCIKEGAPENSLQELIAEIGALCFIRGLHEFQREMTESGGDLVKVLTSNSRATTGYIQDCANTLFEVEKDPEQETKPGDTKLLDFLKSRGVVHMPDRKLPLGNEDALDSLRQMAKSMGMPDEVFEKITGEAMSGEGRKDDCDCPACTLRRKLEAMGMPADLLLRLMGTLEQEEGSSPYPDGLRQMTKALRDALEQDEERDDEAPVPTSSL